MGTGEVSSEKDPADDTFKDLMDLKECIKDSPQFRQAECLGLCQCFSPLEMEIVGCIYLD